MTHLHGWLSGLAAFTVCMLMLPLVRRLAMRWGLTDAPGALKIHAVPIPRLGGAALCCALLTGISIAGTALFSPAVDFYLALVLIWTFGLIDDLRSLPPQIKLVAQFAAGLLLARTQWELIISGSSILNAAATCLFVAVFVNAFNFFDGADGMAGGVAGIIGLGYVLLYANQEASVGRAVAWSLLGSCAAFLLFNFPPAKIFMGDSGSTVLGLVVAFLGLDFYRAHRGSGAHLLLPLAFAGLPLLDFFLAVFRRIRKGSSPFAGDRRHFYDLLLQRGWSAPPVALGAYGVTTILVVGGWLCIQPNWFVAIPVLSATFAFMLIAAIRLGSLQ